MTKSPKGKHEGPSTKERLETAGYAQDEIEHMSKTQLGVISYFMSHGADLPAPDDIDDAYLAGGKSAIDKLAAYWRTTKGGHKEVEGDVDEAIAAAGATAEEMGSPNAHKKGKKK